MASAGIAGTYTQAVFDARKASSDPVAVPRILVVSNVGTFGGGGAVGFQDVVLALRRQRPNVEVVAVYPRNGDLAAECARHGVRTKIAWIPWWAYIQRLPIPHIEAALSALPLSALLLPGIVQAVLLLARLRPTMVLTNTMTIPSHAIAAKLLGIPHHWMVIEFGRDDHRLWFLFGYQRTIHMIKRLSASVICNSHAVERNLLMTEPEMTTSVVYPAVESPKGTASERMPGERMRAVLVGYLSRAKGQRLAIEAVALARKSGVEIELSLVGAGMQRPLRRLARQLGVGDLVSIHGPTPELGQFWTSAHVGLMCSRCEAFGRVTVEAMRAGLPVCGTDSGGTPEIIDHGVNGLLSPAGDAGALATNLMALESDEDLRRSLADGALKSIQRFERDRHDGELTAILGLR